MDLLKRYIVTWVNMGIWLYTRDLKRFPKK